MAVGAVSVASVATALRVYVRFINYPTDVRCVTLTTTMPCDAMKAVIRDAFTDFDSLPTDFYMYTRKVLRFFVIEALVTHADQLYSDALLNLWPTDGLPLRVSWDANMSSAEAHTLGIVSHRVDPDGRFVEYDPPFDLGDDGYDDDDE